MKKSILVLVILALCLTSLFALTACNKDEDYSLTFDEKYVYSITYHQITAELEIEDQYYIFKKDGTGIYGYLSTQTNTNIYVNGSSHHYDEYKYGYSIFFKYTYLDNDKSTIMAFYDGITYNEDNTVSPENFTTDHSGWKKMILISKNVCVDSDSSMKKFIREGYLKEVPNFDYKK